MRKGLPAVIALVGIAAAATAVWLFPRAFPTIALENHLTQATARARADSFFAAHSLAPTATRRAVRFRSDDSLLTYIDLAAGGADSVNAIIRGRDAALFIWSVRAFSPDSVHEARVDFAPDGRVIGFRRVLAEADKRPDVAADSATALARTVLTTWIGEPADRWRVATTSYETRKVSERKDHTVTFERTDRKIGEAPLRMDVVIAGDLQVRARPYVNVPETFSRRYGEMRSANNQLALFANVGMLVFILIGAWSLRTHSRTHTLRWRAPLAVGSVIGLLLAAAGVNALGSSWFDYDTATPSSLFQAIQAAGAVLGGLMMGGFVALTLAAAESAARTAFPHHLDWWKLWRYRGTREVAGQVGGGYAAAALGFAYVAAFYLVARKALGWWVPSQILDDPNQIATPMPWVTGIAFSLQAGVWEEALFRALPLSVLALWVRNKPEAMRRRWMIAGVVATALVFGFAHANYPSWPPYSRGVELFVEASLWAVLFLRVGLLVTVLAHFTYDLVLFSLFAATGSATEYRVAAAIAGLALALPALIVAWRALRQRGFTAAPDDARFGAWTPPVEEPQPVVQARPVGVAPLSQRSRQLAIGAVVAAAIAAIAVPRLPSRGPAFTASRARALAVADSMLAAHGEKPDGWRRLVTTATDTLSGWSRFLHENNRDSLAQRLAPTYAVPAWWVVRYVHTDGTAAQRAEEWRVRTLPDGRPLDLRHIVADSAPGDSLGADSVRRIARRSLAAAGIDTLRLREVQFEATARPHRRDATVTWTDTTVKLPEGASARVWVTVAGSEPLVTRRGVELPESFRRAERELMTRSIAIAGLFGLVLMGGIVAGVIFVAKRRPIIVTDATFDRRTSRVLIAVLAAAALAGALNGMPDRLFGYDTSETWTSHLTTTYVLAALSMIGALFIAGLWMAFEMVRRRAGIAAWPDVRTGRTVRDALIAGVGLGAVPELGSVLRAMARDTAIGQIPSTLANHLVPFIDGALSLPAAAAGAVSLVAIPLLVILALTPRPRTRWLLVTLVAALGAGMVGSVALTARATATTWPEVALGLGTVVAVVMAIRSWGPSGVATWLVAVLTSAALAALRSATHAPTASAAGAPVVEIVAAIAAIGLVARMARRGGVPAGALGGPDAPAAPDAPAGGATAAAS